MCVAEALPRITPELCPLIGMNQGVCGFASPHAHEECVQHEVLSERGFGGPADYAEGVQVHHDGQREPAFPGAHVRHIRDPRSV